MHERIGLPDEMTRARERHCAGVHQIATEAQLSTSNWSWIAVFRLQYPVMHHLFLG